METPEFIYVVKWWRSSGILRYPCLRVHYGGHTAVADTPYGPVKFKAREWFADFDAASEYAQKARHRWMRRTSRALEEVRKIDLRSWEDGHDGEE